MRIYELRAVVTALTSISHIGESLSVASMLRREKIIQADGSIEEVPIISGNSIRGVLRDVGMLHMLRKLGYGEREARLRLPAFHFLLSGGALTKDGSGALSVEDARRWRELIPLVSLFGGALGTQILPGKLKMGKMIPICIETAHLLPAEVAPLAQSSVWDMLQQEAYTRKDDAKNENIRHLLHDPSDQQQALLAATESEAKPQQMRYYVETIAAGTRLYWDMILCDVTELEFDAFAVTLAEFGRMPFIGGRSAAGHGKIAINFTEWMVVDPRKFEAAQKLDMPLGTAYIHHLETHAAEIRKMVESIT